MSINLGIKVLAGAVALAISGGAFAQVTTADTSGTIFVNIDDATSGASYVFDTGISVASFTGNTAVAPISLSGDSNYTSFISHVNTGDAVQYSVVGGSGVPSVSAEVLYTSNTALATPTVTTAGNTVFSAYQGPGNYLATINNPKGASSYYAAGSNPADQWIAGGYESLLTSNTVQGDGATVGTSLGFFEGSTLKPNSTKQLTGTFTTLAGTWLLDSSGNLSYSVGSSTVPLPAPLVLLMSGLGLMGVVARRRQSASAVQITQI